MSEIEWRRRWKPDFHAQSWRALTIGKQTYFVKSRFDDVDSSYQVLITDCMSVWYETVDGEQLRKRSKKFNPSVEAPVGRLLEHIKDHLEEPSVNTDLSANVRGEGEESRLVFTITSRLAGLPYVWKFNAVAASKEMVSEHLTVPLLTMVSEHQRREEELFKALRAKDKEIEDLRAQGVKSSRRHLETGAFDDTVFYNNMDTSKAFEDGVRQAGSGAFSQGSQNLYKAIMAKRAWMNRDISADADGESLDDDGSVPADRVPSGESWANRIPPSVGQSTTATQSPKKSPVKSPVKANPTPEASPAKDTELLRRQALERRLQDEEAKKDQKPKKKKKIKF